MRLFSVLSLFSTIFLPLITLDILIVPIEDVPGDLPQDTLSEKVFILRPSYIELYFPSINDDGEWELRDLREISVNLLDVGSRYIIGIILMIVFCILGASMLHWRRSSYFASALLVLSSLISAGIFIGLTYLTSYYNSFLETYVINLFSDELPFQYELTLTFSTTPFVYLFLIASVIPFVSLFMKGEYIVVPTLSEDEPAK